MIQVGSVGYSGHEKDSHQDEENPSCCRLFVKEAKEAGFVNLKGHRTVGGMRASIYNAMPIEGVEKLVAFMREFEKKHTN